MLVLTLKDLFTIYDRFCPFYKTNIPKTTALFHWYLYHATHCACYMSVEDDRHPERKKGSLSQIKTTSSWPAFDCHTVLIEDKELRVRIEPVPEGTDSSFKKSIIFEISSNTGLVQRNSCVFHPALVVVHNFGCKWV